MADQRAFQILKDYLTRIPAVTGTIGSGFSDDCSWWVKFTLDAVPDQCDPALYGGAGILFTDLELPGYRGNRSEDLLPLR